jgi:hypothetical protein
MVEKGLLSDGEVEKRMTEIREREILLREKVEASRKEYANMVSKEDIEQVAENFKMQELDAQVGHSYHGSKGHFNGLTLQEKKAILTTIFNGKFKEKGLSKRFGIYVKRGEKGWLFEIRGAFPKVTGRIDNGLKVDANGLDHMRA